MKFNEKQILGLQVQIYDFVFVSDRVLFVLFRIIDNQSLYYNWGYQHNFQRYKLEIENTMVCFVNDDQ